MRTGSASLTNNNELAVARPATLRPVYSRRLSISRGGTVVGNGPSAACCCNIIHSQGHGRAPGSGWPYGTFLFILSHGAEALTQVLRRVPLPGSV